ncbi:DUF2393 domain-containing protein [Hoyosella sp. YIM 151337]|uniref:DUF2393 domain-containing protein n=1 Tax=Hoyosella sp. YIM 151337 TaxID=2992742 RepID=UPI002235D98A|nr:DUF2393 domain-containing protein [Hoyosella sp. YIM 151337]MCW4354806.1 DUF2393 domain-containing protein [Hoyosella sp. YIM 151337]
MTSLDTPLPGTARLPGSSRRNACRTLCAFLAGLVILLAGAPITAGAQPDGVIDTDGAALAPLSVTLDSISPAVVTVDSAPTLVVTGTITNTTSGTLRTVAVRLQRAAAVSSQPELRRTANLTEADYRIITPTVPVATELEPGESARFTITFPYRSEAGNALHIAQPGVYPLLVSTTAATVTGAGLRSDEARFLLPVLGLPRSDSESAAPDTDSPNTASGAAAVSEAPVAPTARDPLPLTMLWPLAETPRIAPGGTGDVRNTRLLDDSLADSIRAGGRLDTALRSVEEATARGAPSAAQVADALCLAIDPDLLIAVDAMQRGYQVLMDPNDPIGPTRPGTGTEAAAEWLERLRALAGEICTVSLPYAQVDLEAIARLGNAGFSAQALVAPDDILAAVLGAEPVRSVTLPEAGLLSERSAGMLASTIGGTVLLARNQVVQTTSDEQRRAFARISLPTASQPDRALSAALFDPVTASAMAAVGGAPQVPSFVTGDARAAAEVPRIQRMHDGLGALVWPALAPAVADDPQNGTEVPEPLLVVPPQNWELDPTEGSALLRTLADLIGAGLIAPAFLGDIAAEAARGDNPDAIVQYPTQNDADRIADDVLEPLSATTSKLEHLRSALVADPANPLTPEAYLAPLWGDLLRALSAADRRVIDADGSTSHAAADSAARLRLTAVQETLNYLHTQVTVLNPGGVYTLASGQSPLLLVARNDLPVPVQVRLLTSAPPGVNIVDLGVEQLPARSHRQLSIPTEVSHTRQFAVDIQLTTPDHHVLGEAIRISVRSTAYGQIMTILTACAGALLLALAGRRLWHRFRGQPDPADEGHEHP